MDAKSKAYLAAVRVVRRDVSVGFCRWCERGVPYEQRRFCDATCERQFRTAEALVQRSRQRIIRATHPGRSGSYGMTSVLIRARTDNVGYMVIIGRSVWYAMGRPQQVGFLVTDGRIYLVPDEGYRVLNTRYGAPRLNVGLQRIMALGLRPIRYTIEQHAGLFILYATE